MLSCTGTVVGRTLGLVGRLPLLLVGRGGGRTGTLLLGRSGVEPERAGEALGLGGDVPQMAEILQTEGRDVHVGLVALGVQHVLQVPARCHELVLLAPAEHELEFGHAPLGCEEGLAVARVGLEGHVQLEAVHGLDLRAEITPGRTTLTALPASLLLQEAADESLPGDRDGRRDGLAGIDGVDLGDQLLLVHVELGVDLRVPDDSDDRVDVRTGHRVDLGLGTRGDPRPVGREHDGGLVALDLGLGDGFGGIDNGGNGISVHSR